jgi:hypothetical protein
MPDFKLSASLEGHGDDVSVSPSPLLTGYLDGACESIH